MTRFSVNINKIALLRNSRGGAVPDIVHAARIAMDAGADGITVHPRPDGRHIRRQDVYDLREKLTTELNIEGNPTDDFVELVLDVKPEQCTLVPDAPDQLTSDHGWDVLQDGERLRPIVDKMKAAGIHVSLFMDPEVDQIQRVAATGADRIELYTEEFANAFAAGDLSHTLAHYIAASSAAAQHGLGVNAGHDLNQRNVGKFLHEVPHIREVSIGHALISDALFEDGLANVVKKYANAVRNAHTGR